MVRINTLIDFIILSYNQRHLLILFVGMSVCAFFFGVSSYFIGVGNHIGDTREIIIILDLLFNYSEEQAYAQMQAYGEQGREVYLISVLLLDSLFPMFYGAFFSLILAYLFQFTMYRRIILLPIIVVIIDFIENTHIALMLINFPERMPLVAYSGSIFTNTKWILIGFLVLMVGAGFLIRNRKNLSRGPINFPY